MSEQKPITKEQVDKATVEQYYKLVEIRDEVRAIKGWVIFIGIIFGLFLLLAIFAGIQAAGL